MNSRHEGIAPVIRAMTSPPRAMILGHSNIRQAVLQADPDDSSFSRTHSHGSRRKYQEIRPCR